MQSNETVGAQSAGPSSMRVLLADDHVLMADSLKFALERDGNVAVTTVHTGDAMLAQPPAFDIVLVDLVMPGMDGLTGIGQAIARFPDAAVVVFSGIADSEVVTRAVQMGARGFIPKAMPLRSVSAVLQLIRSGQTYVPMAMVAGIEPANDASGRLTDTEIEVLRAIAEGKTNKRIARDLVMTEIAVKMHLRTIFAKLRAANRTHAVVLAKARHIL